MTGTEFRAKAELLYGAAWKGTIARMTGNTTRTVERWAVDGPPRLVGIFLRQSVERGHGTPALQLETSTQEAAQ